LLWVGEQGVRLYAQSMGETRSASDLLRQAQLCTDPSARLGVVERMDRIRFMEQIGLNLSLCQIRGKERVRVRETYAHMSRETGIAWSGRSYNRGDWHAAHPINRAVSAANSCLCGVCRAGDTASAPTSRGGHRAGPFGSPESEVAEPVDSFLSVIGLLASERSASRSTAPDWPLHSLFQLL
jgi:CRISPR/Cas system-associated endonuclease Cas1